MGLAGRMGLAEAAEAAEARPGQTAAVAEEAAETAGRMRFAVAATDPVGGAVVAAASRSGLSPEAAANLESEATLEWDSAAAAGLKDPGPDPEQRRVS